MRSGSLSILVLVTVLGCEQNSLLIEQKDLTSNRPIPLGSWSTPATMDLWPDSVTYQVFALDLEWDGSILYYVHSPPAEFLSHPAQRHKLSVATNDGFGWEINGVLNGASHFNRARVLPVDGNRLRMFWAGDPPDEVPDLPIPDDSPFDHTKASNVYTCEWEDGACGHIDSLRLAPSRAFIQFSEVVRFDGVDHIFATEHTRSHHLIASAQSLQQVQAGFRGISPSLITTESGILAAYGDIGNHPIGFALHVRNWTPAGWDESRIVYSTLEESVQRITIFSDSSDEIHLSWASLVRAGGTNVRYAVSVDGGLTWSEPVVIRSDFLLFVDSPIILRDRFGNINLLWGNLDFPSQHWYHSVLIRSGWTSPQKLFPELPEVTSVEATSEDNGNIHAVWRTEYTLYHSVYR